MKDVTCTGSESDIGICKFTGWTVHDCTHSGDIGVDCGMSINTWLKSQESQSDN